MYEISGPQYSVTLKLKFDLYKNLIQGSKFGFIFSLEI